MIELSKKATKALGRWCEDEFYVYARPITSRFLRPGDTSIHWNVMVEFRNVGWKRWHAAGSDLDKVLLRLADEIPRRSDLDPAFKAAERAKGSHAPAGPLGTNDFTKPSTEEITFWVDNNVPPPDVEKKTCKGCGNFHAKPMCEDPPKKKSKKSKGKKNK